MGSEGQARMRSIHEPGKWIAIEQDGIERLRYHYQMEGDPAPSAPRPFCHPIRTPDGTVITALGPADHFWHRGLWFAWKFVNGVNYWEENQEPFGRQITLAPPVVEESAPDRTVRWTSELAWQDTRDGSEQTRLDERRVLACRLAEDGTMMLDWRSAQTAREDVTLDRTPFTTWGGYGGLFVRMAHTLERQRILFAGGAATNRPTGETYRWGAIEGTPQGAPRAGSAGVSALAGESARPGGALLRRGAARLELLRAGAAVPWAAFPGARGDPDACLPRARPAAAG
jgi:hypothetical protein